MLTLCLMFQFLLHGRMVHKLRSRRGQCLNHEITKKSRDGSEYSLNCSAGSKTNTSPGTYPTSYTAEDEDHNGPAPSICPDYFRWIHEDLRLWVHTGITREMIEQGREPGHFRLVIVKGEAYVERLKKSFQSRDTFTLWGILQLLSRYPGQIPDLDLIAMTGRSLKRATTVRLMLLPLFPCFVTVPISKHSILSSLILHSGDGMTQCDLYDRCI